MARSKALPFHIINSLALPSFSEVNLHVLILQKIVDNKILNHCIIIVIYTLPDVFAF